MNLPAPTTTSACGNCGLTTRWFLHDVNLRGTERRLCTSCVLRQNPSSFCPSCFEFFDHPLSATSSAAPNRFLSCVECSSLTHLRCLPSPHPSPTTFRCPRCSSPTPSSFSFFPIDRSTPRQLDASLAAVLLCAAKIAAASISRAHSSAKAKADRSVREAAAARKRARDALDHLCAVEMARRAAVDGSMEVSGSRNLGIRKVINPVNGNANANSNSNGLSENKNGLRGNNNNNNNNTNNNNNNNNGSAASDDGK